MRVSCSKELATEIRWDYKRKCFFYFHKSNYDDNREVHVFRDWMGLKLHFIIEQVILKIARPLHYVFSSKYLFYLPYDIVYGLLTCYTMREIISFWRGR